MKVLTTALVGAFLAGGCAWAQDTGLVPRSSSPGGFRVENAAHQADASGPTAASGRGGPAGVAGTAAGGGVQSSAGAAVQIQGNTNINATGRNVDATVVGAQNRGCTHVGGIGSNCR